MTALVLMSLILAGCQQPGRTSDAENSDIQIALQPMPLEDTLVVVLTDASGAPVTDATVAVEGNMNHAGMIPVLADPVADDADGSADGRYHLPFTFTMFGDWIITVNVTQADGSSFSRNLDVRASSSGIEGEQVIPMEGEMPPMSPEPAGDHGGTHGEDAHEEGDDAEHGALVEVTGAMARPAPLAGGTGAVYFTLHNHSDSAITLTGADSPAAGAVEIHTTINDNGVMRMRQLEGGVEVAAGDAVALTPGAMHLMLIDLAAPLAAGDTIAVTLHFDGADDFTFDVPVADMDDLPAEGEMEHEH